jgi:hypothetical protein
MSRIRDALKRAETWQPPERPVTLVPLPFAPKSAAVAPPPAEVPEEVEEEQDAPPRVSKIASLLQTWPRKLWRWARLKLPIWVAKLPPWTARLPWAANLAIWARGLSGARAVPLCRGITRQGQPCRGPAMANGYCRVHGGSRKRGVKPGRSPEPEEAKAAVSG